MDYKKQVLAFEKKLLQTPYNLSLSAQILWHRINTLNYLQNLQNEKWLLAIPTEKWLLAIPTKELCKYLGLSRRTIAKSTEELSGHNFIEYVVGAKATAAEYHLKKLY